MTPAQLLDFLGHHVKLQQGVYRPDVSKSEALALGIDEAVYEKLEDDVKDMNRWAKKMQSEGVDLPDPKDIL